MIVAETKRSARDDALQHYHFWSLGKIGRYALARHIAENVHKLQFRATGDLYVTHVYGVAQILVDAGLERDLAIRASALLHDVLEDCPDEDRARLRRDIRRHLGLIIYLIVEGLTRKKGQDYSAQMARLVRKLHRFGLWRLPLIKLADILFNLSTIEGFNDFEREIRQFDKARHVLDETIIPSRKYIPRRYLAAFDHLFESVETLIITKRQETIDRERRRTVQLRFSY